MNFSDRLKQTLEQIEKDKLVISPLPNTNVADTHVTVTMEDRQILWIDPRPDLPNSKEWADLMGMIDQAELKSMLETMREVGTILERQNRMYKLVPHIDSTGKHGWESVDDFNKMKKHLMPYIGTIEALMLQLHKRCDPR